MAEHSRVENEGGIGKAKVIGGESLGQKELETSFYMRVRKFPRPLQSLLSGLSEALLEEDIRRQFRTSESDLNSLIGELRQHGLGEKDVWLTMTFFSLPYIGKKLE